MSGSQFLLFWFLSCIVGLSIKRRLSLIYAMTSSQVLGYTYTYIFMLTSACKFFHQVDHDSRKGLLQNRCLQRTPMIPLAEKAPCGSLPAGMPLVLKRLHSYVSAAHKAAVSPASCSWLLGKPEVGPVL